MGDTENTHEQAAGTGAAPEYPLPPATFEFLVLRTVTEAQMFLGLLHFGDEKEEAKPKEIKIEVA